MNRLDYRKKTLKWNRLFRTPKVQTLIDEKFEELFGELKKSSEGAVLFGHNVPGRRTPH